jgi:NAD(P)H-dependent FMN reductase
VAAHLTVGCFQHGLDAVVSGIGPPRAHVIGASAGASGAARAQAELRKTLAAAGADVLERELSVPHAGRAFDDRGRLRDTALADRLTQLLRALAATADPDSANQAA